MTTPSRSLAVGMDLWVETRDIFEKVRIESETRMSWVMADGQKIPKSTTGFIFEVYGFNRRTTYYFTEQAAQDAKVMSLSWKMSDMLRYPNRPGIGPDAMRKIAELLGLDTKLES